MAFPVRVEVDRGQPVPLPVVNGVREPHDIRLYKRKWLFALSRLPVNTELRDALQVYFARYHDEADESFDCYAFANLYAGVPQHKVALSVLFWKHEQMEVFRPGDVVFLMDKADRRNFKHAAVMLDDDICISVFGTGGQIEFTTLTDMRKDFGDAVTYRGTPLTIEQ